MPLSLSFWAASATAFEYNQMCSNDLLLLIDEITQNLDFLSLSLAMTYLWLSMFLRGKALGSNF